MWAEQAVFEGRPVDTVRRNLIREVQTEHSLHPRELANRVGLGDEPRDACVRHGFA